MAEANEDLEPVRGSGNVFADFAAPDAALRQLRSLLAAEIVKTLDAERPTFREAATRTGIAAADFSRIRQVRLERFTVRVGQKQLIVRSAEVLWFGAEDKLVFAAVEGDKHWIDLTLDELERRLDPARFLRVHRSAIVNLDRATALRPAFAGTYRLQLDDAARTEVPVSRARARILRERFGA